MQVREASVSPWKAKEAKLLCPHCSNAVYVPLPWNCTAERRQRLVSEAVNEHRTLCLQAPSDEGRVYSISYPRA